MHKIKKHWGALLVFVVPAIASALECPPYPQQANKDWEVEVNAAVGKIGPVKGGELATRTKNATKDLMGKLPDSDRVYLEQMMYAGYCTALRDDKTLAESEKAKQLLRYAKEVRSAVALTPTETAKSTPSPSKKIITSTPSASKNLAKKITYGEWPLIADVLFTEPSPGWPDGWVVGGLKSRGVTRWDVKIEGGKYRCVDSKSKCNSQLVF